MRSFSFRPSILPRESLREIRHGRLRAVRTAEAGCDHAKEIRTNHLTIEELRREVSRLARSLRAEKSRGLCADRGYDLGRHVRLAQEHRRLIAEIKARRSAAPAPANIKKEARPGPLSLPD